MRVRTCGLAALALGILIGAGGCSADSPTAPLAPSGSTMSKGGTVQTDPTSATTQGGLLNGGGRQQTTDGSEETVQSFGGLLNGGG